MRVIEWVTSVLIFLSYLSIVLAKLAKCFGGGLFIARPVIYLITSDYGYATLCDVHTGRFVTT